MCICRFETYDAEFWFNFLTEWVQLSTKQHLFMLKRGFFSQIHNDVLTSVEHVLKVLKPHTPCIFKASSNLFTFSNILSFLKSRISFLDLALSFSCSFFFFCAEMVWRDGARTALDESQLCQVRYATLASASCPFVKSLLSQGCSLFRVLKGLS